MRYENNISASDVNFSSILFEKIQNKFVSLHRKLKIRNNMDVNSVMTHLIALLIGALAGIGLGRCMYLIHNFIEKHWPYNCL